MAGESEETVSEARSTEEILAETEQLLSETGGDSGDGSLDSSGADRATPASSETNGAADTGLGGAFPPETEADRSDERTDAGRSWRARLTPSLPSPSLSSLFSVRAFLGLVAALGIGYVGGGMTIPIAGSLIGLFVVAFLIGAMTSKRRYTEMVAAGSAVGGVTALFDYFVVIVGGFSSRLVLVGLATGLLACLFGYYFGRDLRAGLTREP
ncbi:hypothetical protein C479_05018 [Halovivax asiaticus JCM 14624]|uniref:DUF456 domain-containing protein n=1 Tax=Halovivax asiaticus JCM 14624 TaxID=1227490 RepID=M0BMM4_9EURY|nr:hypothetical protein [Halovivax asiaticus]ELZ12141.1 hypothetical protein C479_05018 [Halovivax asiaticus JCM 14624]